ncbi:MAG TPA: hypothetical protein PK402_09955 [Tepidisphaeraceae bacterium]|nr:hypothetical protein [Tepidisphaeraceae bacterium]
MSTTLAHQTVPVPNRGFLTRYHFLLRRLHSLTGVLFGGYLIVHLLVNSTLAQGPGGAEKLNVFQEQVNKIHDLPHLVAIEWMFIYLPIIYHTLYGIYITVIGQPNIARYGYTRNWLYIFQRITAVILIFFLLFHVLTFKGVLGGVMQGALIFKPDDAYFSTVKHLMAAWWIWAVIYPIGVLSAAFHLANGFYAAAITWGLTISRKAQLRWAAVCALIFFTAFGSGMAALVGAIVNSNVLDRTQQILGV